MFSVFKGVPTFLLLTIGLFISSINSSEGYQPLDQLPVASFAHYTNPVLFPSSSLIQPHPLVAPVEVPAEDSASNIVRVLIHKEIKVQPNGGYSGITGETTKIIVPREETENIETPSERETRRIKPATNSVSGYSYNIPQNSFQVPTSQNYAYETKSATQSQESVDPEIGKGTYTNSHGGYTSKEELGEDPSSYESSEETTEDQPSGYNYKKGNTKKDLQRDFFQNPSEQINADDESEDSDSDVNPTDKTPDVDLELLHTISEQFLLSNGKLTQLNASDFVLMDKENEQPGGYYNYNVDQKSDTNSKHGSDYNSSESTETLSSSEENEETEEYSAPSTEKVSYTIKDVNQGEKIESQYQQVVKSPSQKLTSQVRPDIENRHNNFPFQNNYPGRQVTPKPSFDSASTGYNSRLENSMRNQRLNQHAENFIGNQRLNQHQSAENSMGNQRLNQHAENSMENQQLNQHVENSMGNQRLNQHVENSIGNQRLNHHAQNSMNQKLNLVRQLQSYNKPSNYSYDNDGRNFKEPSPSYGYNSPSESQHQAEADELNVFLFDAPRFSSLRSPNPTQQTYNEIPASYTRRPLKLQKDPLIKSHYDRTLFQNVGNTISTRPTKSSRTLYDQDNNQWHPVTSRSTIQPPLPEKLRQINSFTKTNSKIQYARKTSGERIAPNFQSFSSKSNDTKGNIKTAPNLPVSIQDIIRSQKDESESESKEERINFNQSTENGNRPLFSLIDELTGVIRKHKDAASSSEEVLTKSYPQNSFTTHNERLFSTQTPPQLSTFRNNEPRRETNINLPQLSGDTNVNQFNNFAPSQSSQTLSTTSTFTDVRQNATSSNQIQTQLTINNSSINNENQNNNQKLYYYSNDSRRTSPRPFPYSNGPVKVIMAVRPYVQESRRNRAKGPFRTFLNSLHALKEKNKNRHSHVHELLVNSLNLRKQKSSPPENLTNTPSFKLTPSIYSAVPIYKVEPIPIPQSPFPDFPEGRRPNFAVAVSPVNSEVEIIDRANTDSNRGAQITGGYSSQSQILPAPVIGRSQPITAQDTETKPKEYLGDKYARLGENLFYRVHHIFKQFVPPVLHLGSNEPPK